PTDEADLIERTEALAEWCQGFTYGLVAGGLKQQAELPVDSAEIIRDLTEIARAGLDEELQDEADEDAYMQLHEYVRMGVLLINEELQPLKQESPVTLH
ncbi:MAG: YecA family protein, partial [Gammaproteobacteria bacterium]